MSIYYLNIFLLSTLFSIFFKFILSGEDEKYRRTNLTIIKISDREIRERNATIKENLFCYSFFRN